MYVLQKLRSSSSNTSRSVRVYNSWDFRTKLGSFVGLVWRLYMGNESCYVVLRARSTFLLVSHFNARSVGPALMISSFVVSFERPVYEAGGSLCVFFGTAKDLAGRVPRRSLASLSREFSQLARLEFMDRNANSSECTSLVQFSLSTPKVFSPSLQIGTLLIRWGISAWVGVMLGSCPRISWVYWFFLK